MEKVAEKHSIYIFISSTFTDMGMERDIINNAILNQLREDFATMNVDICSVDLRWGINTTDAEDTQKRNEKIIKVCMSEIDRCHPYFIGLLGKRYGWTPNDELLYSCFPKNDIEQCRQFYSTNQLSVTALEIYHALVQKKFDFSRCFICQRDDTVYSTIPQHLHDIYIDSKHQRDLDEFQNRIISYFTGKAKNAQFIRYGGDWDEKQFAPEMTFYNALYKNLHNAIQQDIQKEISFNNEIERENYYQDLFIQRTSSNTIIRHDEIAEIEQMLYAEDTKIVLHATSGQGKSTFLCQLYNHLIEKNQFEVLLYSAVASSNATLMSNLIESLSHRIANLTGEEFQIVEKTYSNNLSGTDFKDYTSLLHHRDIDGLYDIESSSYEQIILKQFLKHYSTYTRTHEKPLLILIDAYDRFEKSSLFHSLQWLKTLNVRFVITTTSDIAMTSNTLAPFQKKTLSEFTKEEAFEYITNNTGRKELHKTVIDAIIERKKEDGRHAYTSPLWLKLIVHVLNSLDITDFQNIDLIQDDDKEKRIHNYMLELVNQVPTSPGEALLFLIKKAETYIGHDFAAEVLQLLAFSDYGLREKDLEELMNDKWSKLDFAVLRLWFRPYLILGNENQWYLAHQLFANTIKNKFKGESDDIYNRLFSLCIGLPDDDMIRIKMGMLYAIHSKRNVVWYYTYRCRLAPSIQQATRTLIEYLRACPDYLDEIINRIGNGTFSFNKCGVDEDYYDRFTTERILFTLGNQLYKQGLFRQAKALYLHYEPILERNTTEMYVKELLLPMVYRRLASIYQNEYNREMHSYYKEKAERLNENADRQETGNNGADENETNLDIEYANIISTLNEHAKQEGNPCIEELYDLKFRNHIWEKTDIDRIMHILGDIYASISCPTYNPEYTFWKQELPNAIGQYNKLLPRDESDWEMEIPTTNRIFLFKYNEALMFMEFLLNKLVNSHRDMALRMQHDCLCLYRSVTNKLKNEHYYDECALGHSLAGEFYLRNQETEKAIKANLWAVQYSSHALNIYPHSIKIQQRYLYTNHSLGECFLNTCRFEQALQPLTIYHDGIKEILNNDPTQLTMVSSYICALESLGRCNLYLQQYSNALKHFDTMLDTIRKHIKDVQTHEHIYFEWATMLFNCKYFIARCYIESGHEEIGYSWANNLYNELIHNGFTPDSNYEPMENVCELLGMKQYHL